MIIHQDENILHVEIFPSVSDNSDKNNSNQSSESWEILSELDDENDCNNNNYIFTDDVIHQNFFSELDEISVESSQLKLKWTIP